MVFSLCKKLIEAGSYEYQSMLGKLDVFLLGNRITSAQYTDLTGMMDAQQVTE